MRWPKPREAAPRTLIPTAAGLLWGAGCAASLALLGLSLPRVLALRDPGAQATIGADSSHYLDLVTRLPRDFWLVSLPALALAAAAGYGGLALAGLRLRVRSPGGALFAVGAGLALLTYLFMGLGWLRQTNATSSAVVLAGGVLAIGFRAASSFRAGARLRLSPPSAGELVLALATAAALPWLMAVHPDRYRAYLDLVAALGPECWLRRRWSGPQVPLYRQSSNPVVDARPYYAWNYLYGRETVRQVVGFPIAWYIDDHLRASDKVYDACQLIAYYVYSRPEVFNGWGFDGPTNMGEWSMTSPDALQRMRAEGITHVVICTGQEPLLRQTPLWPHLVSDSPPGMDHRLYRIDYS